MAGAVGMLCFYSAIRSAIRWSPIAFTSPLFGALMGLLAGTESLHAEDPRYGGADHWRDCGARPLKASAQSNLNPRILLVFRCTVPWNRVSSLAVGVHFRAGRRAVTREAGRLRNPPGAGLVARRPAFRRPAFQISISDKEAQIHTAEVKPGIYRIGVNDRTTTSRVVAHHPRRRFLAMPTINGEKKALIDLARDIKVGGSGRTDRRSSNRRNWITSQALIT